MDKKAIEVKIVKKDILVQFYHPFSWKFVELCKKNGLKWDGTTKVWSIKFTNATIPLTVARLIENYKELFDLYEEAHISFFTKIMNSAIKKFSYVPEILTEPLDLNDYPELFEHQKAGIQFLCSRNTSILADEQGLGKTKQACIWLLKQNPKKSIIVCPLSARFIWKNELLSLGLPGDNINIVEKNLDKEILIINYDKLKKFAKDLIKIPIDVMIFDEAHMLKNRASKRFKTAFAISKKIKKIVLATGTPVSNKPEDLFSLLKMAKHPLGKTFVDFANRYCDRKLITGAFAHWDTSGASNLDELSDKITNVMIRRLKKDCLDLPEKIKTTYFIELNEKQKVHYKTCLNRYLQLIHKTTKVDFNTHFVELTLLRQFCSEAKKPYTEEYIKDALDNNEKILIFDFYNKTINELYEKYKDRSVIITGDTPKDSREGIQKAFQTDPNINLFFGNIKAAGTALTLTAGKKIIYNGLSWNPTDHEQSEDRIHRIGTTTNVDIIYPIFSNTIEEYIYDILKNKKILINKIIEKSEEHFKKENIIQELINKFYTL